MGIASTTNLALDVVVSVLAAFMATQKRFRFLSFFSQIYSSNLDPNVLIRNLINFYANMFLVGDDHSYLLLCLHVTLHHLARLADDIVCHNRTAFVSWLYIFVS